MSFDPKRLEEIRARVALCQGGLRSWGYLRELLAMVDALREGLEMIKQNDDLLQQEITRQDALLSRIAANPTCQCCAVFSDENDRVTERNAELREMLRRSAADLRHGLTHPTSAGIVNDVIRRLEQATTPGAT